MIEQYYLQDYSKNYITKADINLANDIVLINQIISNDDSLVLNSIELAAEELQSYISFRYDYDNLIFSFAEVLEFQIAPLPPLASGLVDKDTYIRIKDLVQKTVTTGNGEALIDTYTYYVVKPIWDKSLDLTTDKIDIKKWILIDNEAKLYKRDNLLVSFLVDITVYHIYSRMSTKSTPERIEKNYIRAINNLEKISKGKMSPQNWLLKAENSLKAPSSYASPYKNSSMLDLFGNQGSKVDIYNIQNRNFF